MRNISKTSSEKPSYEISQGLTLQITKMRFFLVLWTLIGIYS